LFDSLTTTKGENAMHEQTIREHVDGNLVAAIDQAGEYDNSINFREGDAYMQNVYDGCIEDGYSHDQAHDATGLFYKLAKEKDVRFSGE
jgi:hypothetical protein